MCVIYNVVVDDIIGNIAIIVMITNIIIITNNNITIVLIFAKFTFSSPKLTVIRNNSLVAAMSEYS